MWYLFYNGMLLSNKKEQSGVVCGGVDRPRYLVCQTERSQKGNTSIVYYQIYMESRKMVQMSLFAG